MRCHNSKYKEITFLLLQCLNMLRSKSIFPFFFLHASSFHLFKSCPIQLKKVLNCGLLESSPSPDAYTQTHYHYATWTVLRYLLHYVSCSFFLWIFVYFIWLFLSHIISREDIYMSVYVSFYYDYRVMFGILHNKITSNSNYHSKISSFFKLLIML